VLDYFVCPRRLLLYTYCTRNSLGIYEREEEKNFDLYRFTTCQCKCVTSRCAIVSSRNDGDADGDAVGSKIISHCSLKDVNAFTDTVHSQYQLVKIKRINEKLKKPLVRKRSKKRNADFFFLLYVRTPPTLQ